MAQADLSSALFQIIVKKKPTFKEVSDLLLKQFNSTFYALLEISSESSLYHIISSNRIDFSITDPSFFQTSKLKITNNWEAKTFQGIPNIHGIILAPISDKIILVLCSESNFDQTKINSVQLQPFTQAYSFLLDKYKLDIDFSIAKVDSYSPEQMNKLSQRSYNVTIFHPSDLLLDTFAMFYRSGISKRAGIDDVSLLSFIAEIREHYYQVPYHNWHHVVDVTQFVFSVINTAHLETILDPDEVFALLVSAIAHDSEHNGLTNNYHRKTNSIYAHRADPELPPLEHHHAELAIALTKPMFSQLSEEKQDKLGHFIISCILATNMEIHKQFLEEFKSIRQTFDKTNPEHRLLLSQIILKSADLSNVVRDFNAAEMMSKQLQIESFRQGDFEEQRGLPYSPMCDKHCKDPLWKGQIGFYKFVAGPLINEINTFLPQLSDNSRQFDENLKQWEKLFEEWKAQNPQ